MDRETDGQRDRRPTRSGGQSVPNGGNAPAGGPSPDRGRPRPPARSGRIVRSGPYEPRRRSAEASFTGDNLEFTHHRSTRHEGRRRRRGGRLVGYILVAVFALILGAGVGYARGYFAEGAVGEKVTVVIPDGASLQDIGERLEQKGVVKHGRAFVIKAESDGYSRRFMPGTYVMRVNEPYKELVAQLLKGVKPPTVKVVIPEGTTVKQAAGIVSGEVTTISRDDYLRAARDDPPSFQLEGYKRGTTLEGMLFPATYDLSPKAKARSFVAEQLDAFTAGFDKVGMTRAKAANLTEYDVVIIASMIEREARVAEERPLVAAVIWNRLRKGMLLQIDATIQYALGETKPELTYHDLEIDSPYNTYKHAGLPPTPIANPGLASLEAAADPAEVKYLYYVARNDGTGRHYFSSSYAQFQVDKAKAAANGD